MRQFTLENYENASDRQVVHMDQGVCYCPEFRATRAMRDYPSRKLQLARAVYRGEMEPTPFLGRTVLHSILSRQGERWQNFREDPEDWTDCMILCRQMLLGKGANTETAGELESIVARNNGHVLDVQAAVQDWRSAFARVYGSEQNAGTGYTGHSGNSGGGGKTVVFLDDATCVYGREYAHAAARFLRARGITLHKPVEPVYDGWEYFVYGLVDKGVERAREVVAALEKDGVDTVITLSGRTEYLLTRFYPKIGVNHGFRVVGILDMADRLQVAGPTYVYAGSFYTRFLGKSRKINDLVPNPQETVLKRSEEFTPILDAPNRVNTVNIWQKPAAAEHLLLGFPETSRSAILQDAVEDIHSVPHAQVAVLDPWAYHALKTECPRDRVVFYPELLM
jgi:hypothetical protein